MVCHGLPVVCGGNVLVLGLVARGTALHAPVVALVRLGNWNKA